MNVINANLTFKSALTKLDLGKVNYIVLHHAEASNATVEDIHRWHLENGWSGIGYNEYIRKDGTVYIGRGDNVGAHCLNYNSISYGICCEGNFNTEEINATQLKSLIERIRYNIPRFSNFKAVKYHKDLGSTECPGFKFPSMLYINDLLNKANAEADRLYAINKLMKYSIINSPEYWLNNAVTGGNIKGEYVAQLIKNMSNCLKEI